MAFFVDQKSVCVHVRVCDSVIDKSLNAIFLSDTSIKLLPPACPLPLALISTAPKVSSLLLLHFPAAAVLIATTF